MTNESISSETKSTLNWGKFTPAILLLVGLLLLFGFVINRQFLQLGKPQVAGEAISAQLLEEQYGMRVNLLAITASGGLVDLRLKVLDAEKAKLLLQDSDDVPTLLVGDGSDVLAPPESSASDLFNSINDDGNIFLIFPNTANIVKPNALVTVQFGDIRLEPITVQ